MKSPTLNAVWAIRDVTLLAYMQRMAQTARPEAARQVFGAYAAQEQRRRLPPPAPAAASQRRPWKGGTAAGREADTHEARA